MSRDHFAQMYKNKSHRHDTPHDSYGFDEAVGSITGMLYSIVTLKAFFPFFKSPAKKAEVAGGPAPYPMPSQIAGDQEEQNKPL